MVTSEALAPPLGILYLPVIQSAGGDTSAVAISTLLRYPGRSDLGSYHNLLKVAELVGGSAGTWMSIIFHTVAREAPFWKNSPEADLLKSWDTFEQMHSGSSRLADNDGN